MISKFEWIIAFRYLKAKRKEKFASVITWLAVIGTALGVATLIIVMSVMNGFRKELIDQILGVNGHIYVMEHSKTPMRNYDNLSDKIKELQKIEDESSIIPTIQSGVLFSSDKGKYLGGLMKAHRIGDMTKIRLLAKNLTKGELTNLKDGEVLIGYILADELGLQVGDSITVTSEKGRRTAFGSIPRIGKFKVGGIFNLGMHQYDLEYVIMSLDKAQKFMELEKKVTHLEIFTENPLEIDDLKEGILELLENKYYVSSWKDLNRGFIKQLNVERNMVFIIVTLIVIIAAFNIISGLVMLVKDKSKDIAVLRTIGATKKAVMRAFIISGTIVGLIGTLTGVIIGVLFCKYIKEIQFFIETVLNAELFRSEIYYLTHLPAIIDYSEVFSFALMALVISFLATIYPARKASKMDPVEALRYE